MPAVVEVRRLAVPLVEPRAAAHGTESVRESILVAVSDGDGISGWGECVALARPTYSGEWIDGAWSVLVDLLVPAALAGSTAGLVGHPMAVAAVEDAVVDLALRRARVALASVLGSSNSVASRAVVGLGPSVDDVVGAVERQLAAGHRSIKLKVEPRRALVDLSAVRQRWPDLDLAADANGSFDPVDHEAVLRGIDDLGLTYLEQPFATDDLRSTAALRRSATTPIALDESATSLGAIRTARDLDAIDLVNVKPARWGGVRAAAGAVDALAAEGIDAFVGGMYELGVARSCALAVAGLAGVADRPADLGPSSSYVEVDLTPAHVLASDGRIAVPQGPGSGPEPDRATVERFTTARVELRP